MNTFIHKHWKKFILSFCAMFWSGCSDESSEDGVLYGPPPCYYDEKGCEEHEPVTYPTGCTVTEFCPSGVTLECDGKIINEPTDSLDNCKAVENPCQRIYNCEDGALCTEKTSNGEKIYECSGWVDVDGENKNHVTYSEDEFNKKYYDSSKSNIIDHEK